VLRLKEVWKKDYEAPRPSSRLSHARFAAPSAASMFDALSPAALGPRIASSASLK